jgi:hypothetical protein
MTFFSNSSADIIESFLHFLSFIVINPNILKYFLPLPSPNSDFLFSDISFSHSLRKISKSAVLFLPLIISRIYSTISDLDQNNDDTNYIIENVKEPLLLLRPLLNILICICVINKFSSLLYYSKKHYIIFQQIFDGGKNEELVFNEKISAKSNVIELREREEKDINENEKEDSDSSSTSLSSYSSSSSLNDRNKKKKKIKKKGKNKKKDKKNNKTHKKKKGHDENNDNEGETTDSDDVDTSSLFSDNNGQKKKKDKKNKKKKKNKKSNSDLPLLPPSFHPSAFIISLTDYDILHFLFFLVLKFRNISAHQLNESSFAVIPDQVSSTKLSLFSNSYFFDPEFYLFSKSSSNSLFYTYNTSELFSSSQLSSIDSKNFVGIKKEKKKKKNNSIEKYIDDKADKTKVNENADIFLLTNENFLILFDSLCVLLNIFIFGYKYCSNSSKYFNLFHKKFYTCKFKNVKISSFDGFDSDSDIDSDSENDDEDDESTTKRRNITLFSLLTSFLKRPNVNVHIRDICVYILFLVICDERKIYDLSYSKKSKEKSKSKNKDEYIDEIEKDHGSFFINTDNKNDLNLSFDFTAVNKKHEKEQHIMVTLILPIILSKLNEYEKKKISNFHYIENQLPVDLSFSSDIYKNLINSEINNEDKNYGFSLVNKLLNDLSQLALPSINIGKIDVDSLYDCIFSKCMIFLNYFMQKNALLISLLHTANDKISDLNKMINKSHGRIDGSGSNTSSKSNESVDKGQFSHSGNLSSSRNILSSEISRSNSESSQTSNTPSSLYSNVNLGESSNSPSPLNFPSSSNTQQFPPFPAPYTSSSSEMSASLTQSNYSSYSSISQAYTSNNFSLQSYQTPQNSSFQSSPTLNSKESLFSASSPSFPDIKSSSLPNKNSQQTNISPAFSTSQQTESNASSSQPVSWASILSSNPTSIPASSTSANFKQVTPTPPLLSHEKLPTFYVPYEGTARVFASF